MVDLPSRTIARIAIVPDRNQEAGSDRLGLMRRMSRIGSAGRGGINRKHAAQQPLAIQTLDSRFQIRGIREFHKAKSS